MTTRRLLYVLTAVTACWYAVAGWLWLRDPVVESGTLLLAEGMGTSDPELLGRLLATLTADDVKGEG